MEEQKQPFKMPENFGTPNFPAKTPERSDYENRKLFGSPEEKEVEQLSPQIEEERVKESINYDLREKFNRSMYMSEPREEEKDEPLEFEEGKTESEGSEAAASQAAKVEPKPTPNTKDDNLGSKLIPDNISKDLLKKVKKRTGEVSSIDVDGIFGNVFKK